MQSNKYFRKANLFFRSLRNSRVKAFTLTELMVVLVIIGILVLLAIPNLMPLISRAKSTEAQLQLKHIYTLEKNYFYMYSKYSNELNAIDYQQEKLTTEGEGGQANYQIEIVEASSTGFKARATAVVDFDGDGIYNIWEIDENKNLKETVKD